MEWWRSLVHSLQSCAPRWKLSGGTTWTAGDQWDLVWSEPFFQCSSLEIDLGQRVLTRLCTTCHGGRLTCQSEESCPQVAIRGEKKVARCPLWGKSGVSHRKSPLGVAASQGDSTLAQVTGGQTPPHRAPAALSLSWNAASAPNPHPPGHRYMISRMPAVEILPDPHFAAKQRRKRSFTVQDFYLWRQAAGVTWAPIGCSTGRLILASLASLHPLLHPLDRDFRAAFKVSPFDLQLEFVFVNDGKFYKGGGQSRWPERAAIGWAGGPNWGLPPPETDSWQTDGEQSSNCATGVGSMRRGWGKLGQRLNTLKGAL